MVLLRSIGRWTIVFMLLALAACGAKDEFLNADLSGVEKAVKASSPRVVNVANVERQVDGLGTAISLEIHVVGSRPLSAKNLDAIIEAVWVSAPFEPNSISLMAFSEDDKKSVDLREAAEKLPPMFAAGFGSGGVSVIGMHKRYGERS